MMQDSPLCRIPAELLENIAVEVILSKPSGSLSSLPSILCSCKQIYHVLRMKNNHSLYARAFRGLFDAGAARRRFGPRALHSSNLAHQLTLYCSALRDIRRGDIYSNNLKYTLWAAFFMISENDGNNIAQLQWAGLDDFVSRFVRTRLFDGRGRHRGWPAENEENALALWLMVMTDNEQKLRSENHFRREQMIKLLLPYTTLACRYPSAHAPANHFDFPMSEEFDQRFPYSAVTAHGPYPLYRDPNGMVFSTIHYGQALTIGTPLITTAAKILYFSRRQIPQFPIPLHLPVNRAHAMHIGDTSIRPTQADIIELNAHKCVQFPPKTKRDWWRDLTDEDLRLEDAGIWHDELKANSARYDNDWERLRHCYNPWVTPVSKGPVFPFGSLRGLWHGRLLVPSEEDYLSLVTTPDYPLPFSEQQPFLSTVPFYMRLREHHCISPNIPAPIGGEHDGFDDGLFNAYFPAMRFQERHGFLTIMDHQGTESHYDTYIPGRRNSHNPETCRFCIRASELEEEALRMKVDSPNHEVESVFENMGLGIGNDASDDDSEDYVATACNGIQDIIVTGCTDLRHGQAWNHYKFYGRVRSWDGLVVILRVALFGDGITQGRWVFTGYLVGGQNLVGNWRAINNDVGVPTWESAFIMSRRDD